MEGLVQFIFRERNIPNVSDCFARWETSGGLTAVQLFFGHG